MNKQELIEVIKNEPYEKGIFVDTIKFNRNWLLRKIEQLDEPETVTIPKFVADYIEFKKKNNFHIYGAMRVIEDHHDKRVPEWFYENNIETFARAWILGYEVEKEKRYIVSLKNGQPLVKAPLGKNFYFNQNITAGNCKATRKELEDAGFGWVFDCEGIEIEEVTE